MSILINNHVALSNLGNSNVTMMNEIAMSRSTIFEKPMSHVTKLQKGPYVAVYILGLYGH